MLILVDHEELIKVDSGARDKAGTASNTVSIKIG